MPELELHLRAAVTWIWPPVLQAHRWAKALSLTCVLIPLCALREWVDHVSGRAKTAKSVLRLSGRGCYFLTIRPKRRKVVYTPGLRGEAMLRDVGDRRLE